MAYDDEVHFLLLEDDELDVRAVERAFNKHGITNPLTVAANGLEGLEILRGKDGCPPLQRPYLILLDINMPRMNGLQFLEELRKDDALRDSIVFVLTSSDADRDIVAAYAQNIAGYIVKRDVGEGFLHLLQLLTMFRITIRFPL